ncbi:hypothetical protein [Terrihabitans rhizophilus]|uniref:Uncharacterized protein n=1 Tax=Terrihabitans rhizophilus TaxID=3092662 RepID=A0ABU4RRY1_9HYPH|nr:hypothetical protein [Terrihabitans sp. PJ23]MDX6805516.1 hypothetical protein [Terrihabitans sp. PJ23]
MMGYRRFSLPWAGLATGPAAWALSFQLNYVLVPWQCAHQLYPVPWAAGVLALVAAAGGLVSWRGWRGAEADARSLDRRPETERFLAALGVMSAALFTAIILLHGLAGLIFHGCER